LVGITNEKNQVKCEGTKMNKNSSLFVNLGPDLFVMIGLPRLPSWRNSDRPKKAKKGTLGFNSQTNSLEYWNGSIWFAAVMSRG
jgi:hypothetical protein